MTSWYALTKEVEYRQKYFRQEAEIARMLNEITPVPVQRRPLVCVLLEKLGEKLVVYGTMLRTRYGISVQ
ncbi:MAG: hypothetical protein MJE63_02350 [Proteobacteria bacterium]|nr:hypothetical protein [Pseudomonadota bacterium]